MVNVSFPILPPKTTMDGRKKDLPPKRDMIQEIPNPFDTRAICHSLDYDHQNKVIT